MRPAGIAKSVVLKSIVANPFNLFDEQPVAENGSEFSQVQSFREFWRNFKNPKRKIILLKVHLPDRERAHGPNSHKLAYKLIFQLKAITSTSIQIFPKLT